MRYKHYMLIAVGIICLLISAALLKNLWSNKNEFILKKIIWSQIILIPLIGWIFYGGFHTAPSAQGADLQTKETKGTRSSTLR